MKNVFPRVAALLTVAAGMSAAIYGQTLPIPDAQAASDIPGARELKIAVVMHEGGTMMILDGYGNPNIAMMRKLANAGVDFRVYGQSVLANKIDPRNIRPEVELDLWALTTLVNLEMRGYVRVGGN